MEKKRILVVDDVEAYTRMTALVLEQTGLYIVGQVNKGTQVVATAREFKPDLILLDIVMPDVDGGDVAARLQADPFLRAVPIIFLTALVDEQESKDKALKAGPFPFLGKLVSDETLLTCIEQNLRN